LNQAPLNRNYDTPACNQLNAFLNQVNAKQNKGQLTSQQAAELTKQAKVIQQSIGCGSVGLVGSSSGDENDGEDLPLPMP